MSDFKITGTPGEPVRLDTLKAGDWYTQDSNPQCNGTIYPCMYVRDAEDDQISVIGTNFSPGVDPDSLLVHPLTRHELADGTVEFRHVGEAKPCGDCKGTKRDNVPYGGPCEACNGTGVKPEPTYLERLPDAVREFIQDRVCLIDDTYETDYSAEAEETIARVICEHMTPKGGEA